MLTDREARLNVANVTGGGELFTASWRWWERRPRVALGLAAPAPFGGVWSVEASDERQAYGTAAADVVERRRTALFGLSDWATGALGWEADIGIDRWGTGTSASLGGTLRYHAAADRAAVRVHAGRWFGDGATWTAGAAVDWRSKTVHDGSVWTARAGFESASAAAPLALWPGAGTGHGRGELLRAHPLLDDGVIGDGVFGRRLAHAHGEWRKWGSPLYRVVRIAPAAFVDVARAFAVPEFGDPRAHADVGVGVRVAFPGAGVLRADVARGLRDGQMALSFGWTR
jgi:hypothetical protein